MKVMKDAQYMQADTLISPQALFYLATLGGARGLSLDDRIGNFESGKEADFMVLKAPSSPLKDKMATTVDATTSPANNLAQLLSRPIYLGDDRWISSTYIRGRQCYSQ